MNWTGNLQFVRYADDSIVMCRTPEELEKAKQVVSRVLDELGLTLTEDKTDEIDFHKKDFDYLGFTFQHIRGYKNGKSYYRVGPGEKSLKKFRTDIKAVTGKTVFKSFEQRVAMLNPKPRRECNCFLVVNRACKAVQEKMSERGLPYSMGFHTKDMRSRMATFDNDSGSTL